LKALPQVEGGQKAVSNKEPKVGIPARPRPFWALFLPLAPLALWDRASFELGRKFFVFFGKDVRNCMIYVRQRLRKVFVFGLFFFAAL